MAEKIQNQTNHTGPVGMRVVYDQSDADPRYNERIIEDIKNRLDAGAKKYGEPITRKDPRNWLQEAYEELLDASVYMCAALLRLMDKGGR
jgi:hypothetical protein|tara:strand:+ start:2650 stop:2919 length:270 start_codon:yes stop_codon:yes gene_type:complete